MAKLFKLFLKLAVVYLMLALCNAVPVEEKYVPTGAAELSESELDLAAADTIGYGYYPLAPAPWPVYHGPSYSTGGAYSSYINYNGAWKYDGYRRYYRRPIYSVWN